MSEQKSMEQVIMEAIDFCTHTRCKKCEYYGKDSTYERNGNCRGRMMADHLRKNGVVVREKGEWEDADDGDGLAQPWAGVCWCNPPYGRGVGEWVRRAHLAAEEGNTVVMLLPARTDTIWFHEYIYQKREVCFIKGRLRFGDGKNNAPFPSMVVFFEPRKHMTNADRIRAMSNEELAALTENTGCPDPHLPCWESTCYECRLNWLRQPVKDGEGK